jgi:hypothetical protein
MLGHVIGYACRNILGVNITCAVPVDESRHGSPCFCSYVPSIIIVQMAPQPLIHHI